MHFKFFIEINLHSKDIKNIFITMLCRFEAQIKFQFEGKYFINLFIC